MKSILTTVLVLLGTALGAQTPALTVRYDQGDVGEEHQRWTTDYYTNAQGQLVRAVRVTEGDSEADPEVREETLYHWTDDGVTWQTTNWDGKRLEHRLRFADQTSGTIEVVETDQKPRTLRYLDDQDTAWTDGKFEFRWDSRSGFTEAILAASGGEAPPRSGWTTKGSRLTEWSKGVENNEVILDRRPDRIVGTFVQANMNLTGWDVTGSLVVQGVGLWTADRLVRLAHMAILNEDRNLAWSAPLVWTRDYLR